MDTAAGPLSCRLCSASEAETVGSRSRKVPCQASSHSLKLCVHTGRQWQATLRWLWRRIRQVAVRERSHYWHSRLGYIRYCGQVSLYRPAVRSHDFAIVDGGMARSRSGKTRSSERDAPRPNDDRSGSAMLEIHFFSKRTSFSTRKPSCADML